MILFLLQAMENGIPSHLSPPQAEESDCEDNIVILSLNSRRDSALKDIQIFEDLLQSMMRNDELPTDDFVQRCHNDAKDLEDKLKPYIPISFGLTRIFVPERVQMIQDMLKSLSEKINALNLRWVEFCQAIEPMEQLAEAEKEAYTFEEIVELERGLEFAQENIERIINSFKVQNGVLIINRNLIENNINRLLLRNRLLTALNVLH